MENRLTIPTFDFFCHGWLFIISSKGFIPTQDNNFLLGRIRLDEATSFQKTRSTLRDTLEILSKEENIASVSSFLRNNSAGNVRLFIQLRDKNDRTESIVNMQSRLNSKINTIGGMRFFTFVPDPFSVGNSSNDGQYEYNLLGPSTTELYRWIPRLVSELQKNKIFSRVVSGLNPNSKAIEITVNRDNTARYNLTPHMISNALYNAFGQRSVSIIYNPLNQTRMIMEVDPQYSADPAILDQMQVSLAGGKVNGSTTSNTIRVVSDGRPAAENKLGQIAFQNQIANSLADGKNSSTGSAISTDQETMIPLPLLTTVRSVNAPNTLFHYNSEASESLFFDLVPGASLMRLIALPIYHQP